MKQEHIVHIGGSQREGWLYLNEDGTITYESENDSHAYLRHASERYEEIMTVEDVVRRWPHHGPKVLEAIKNKCGQP